MAHKGIQRRPLQENRPDSTVQCHQIQKMDVDRPRVQNGPRRHHKGSHEMDTTREEKKRPTQTDMEKVCGKGNERTWMDLGASAALGRRQTALAFIGEDLMCYPA